MSETTQENYFLCTFLADNVRDTRVCHALKTMNEPSQEQCSPAATSPAGGWLPQVLIKELFLFLKVKYSGQKQIILLDEVRFPLYIFFFFPSRA